MSVNERWVEILLTPLRDRISVGETCYDYRRRLDAEGVRTRGLTGFAGTRKSVESAVAIGLSTSAAPQIVSPEDAMEALSA